MLSSLHFISFLILLLPYRLFYATSVTCSVSLPQTYWSRRTDRLFPPVQWWLISFFPGLLLAGVGLILFLSPWMRRDYAVVHSLWHIVIGLSLLGLLPWPRRWRIALVKVIPLQTPLSCGGGYFGLRRSSRIHRVGSIGLRRSSSPSCESLTGPVLEVPVTPASRVSTRFPVLWQVTHYVYTHCRQIFCHAHHILMVICDRLDVWFELDRVLDPIVARWPHLDWLLPNGKYRLFSLSFHSAVFFW